MFSLVLILLALLPEGEEVLPLSIGARVSGGYTDNVLNWYTAGFL